MTEGSGQDDGQVSVDVGPEVTVEQSPEEQLAAAEFLVATRMRQEATNRTSRMLKAAHARK